MIPYGRQDVSDDDIAAVAEVLRSDFLTQGPAVPRFEAAFAAYAGAPHAVAANSATSSLHLACLALGLGPGDRLWTSPITFVASANCARYCGAEVDFVDIDPATWTMSPDALERKLKTADAAGRLPRILVPVHHTGQPCDMAAIGELARKYDVRIVEDAAHAVGARWRDESVGCGRHGDITVFSFHPVKIITSGEGGMATTADAGLAARMALLRSHGITRDPAEMTHSPDGPWYYQQIELGFNYRMTDIQAALGASQLRRADEFIGRRGELARRYDALLADLPLTRPHLHPDARSSWHLYVVRVDPARTRRGRDEIFRSLRDRGIGVNVHYIPVHTQPYYRALGFRPGDFPEAERYYAEALTLPLFPAMTEEQQDRVVDALQEVL